MCVLKKMKNIQMYGLYTDHMLYQIENLPLSHTKIIAALILTSMESTSEIHISTTGKGLFRLSSRTQLVILRPRSN